MLVKLLSTYKLYLPLKVTAECPLESTGKMVNMQSELDFKLSDSIQGDCISYLLEGKCNRKRCNLSHSNSIHGYDIEYTNSNYQS